MSNRLIEIDTECLELLVNYTKDCLKTVHDKVSVYTTIGMWYVLYRIIFNSKLSVLVSNF